MSATCLGCGAEPSDNYGVITHRPGCVAESATKRLAEIIRSDMIDPGTLPPHDVDYASLIGNRVTYHYDNGVELHAVVVCVYHPQLVNLRVYSDGYLLLRIPGVDAKLAGDPVNVTNVREGTGHLNFSWRLDRP